MDRVEKDITVANKKGLHARPAALFVQLADKLNVSVTIQKGEEKINGKSIMALLSLGVSCGTVLKLIIEGDRAQEAMGEFEKFFNKQEEEITS
ncbi:MAG: HPr family phosphocarrier protein [Candidatus Omnitrophica bacterium]|nr:HPr family phosphocarrier protein [Candidatus Omnitrophota bacterium]